MLAGQVFRVFVGRGWVRFYLVRDPRRIFLVAHICNLSAVRPKSVVYG